MSLRACFLGVLSVVAFGCEGERVLGEVDPRATGGDESGGTGGSGDATNGGSASGGTAQGGSAPSGGSAQGGAAPSGGSAQAGAAPSGGSAQGGAAPNGGAAQGGAAPNGGSAQGGTAPSGGNGGSGGICFSPDKGVPNEFANLVGCPCTEDDVDQCVAIGTTQISLLGMVCGSDGRWQIVEDGPCEPGPGSWCMIEGRVFKPGSEVPRELLCEVCHACPTLDDACLLIDCAPPECPAGTARGERCRQCGNPGGCDMMEHGCFEPCVDGERCEFGYCSNGLCRVGPCI
ncbi:MAG TPA: hypothetical protein VFZ53_20525 [Polyangiaceae bacterium]